MKVYGGLLHDEFPAIVFLSQGVAVEASTGFVSVNQFCEICDRATKKHTSQLHAAQANPWSSQQENQAGSSTQGATIEGREEKKAQDSAVEVARAVDSLEQEKKLAKLKEQQEERKRKKKEEDDYKRQLLANIEKDRKRRNTPTSKVSPQDKPNQADSSTAGSQQELKRTNSGTETKIVFRIKDPTGRLHTVKHTFPKSNTLLSTCAEVHSSLEKRLSPHPMPATFHYITNVPPKRRVFPEADYGRTLEDLDLCTNCIVEVEPGKVPHLDTEGNAVISPEGSHGGEFASPNVQTCDSAIARQCGGGCALM